MTAAILGSAEPSSPGVHQLWRAERLRRFPAAHCAPAQARSAAAACSWQPPRAAAALRAQSPRRVVAGALRHSLHLHEAAAPAPLPPWTPWQGLPQRAWWLPGRRLRCASARPAPCPSLLRCPCSPAPRWPPLTPACPARPPRRPFRARNEPAEMQHQHARRRSQGVEAPRAEPPRRPALIPVRKFGPGAQPLRHCGLSALRSTIGPVPAVLQSAGRAKKVVKTRVCRCLCMLGLWHAACPPWVWMLVCTLSVRAGMGADVFVKGK
jgi:hypothetical protein